MRDIQLFKVFSAPECAKAVEDVLNSGYIGEGPKANEFAEALKKIFNKYLVVVNSCTSALQLAIYLNKPKEGFKKKNHIIVAPLTCFASISAIIANNLRVKWADVDPNTCNIDLFDVEKKLDENTIGIMPVYWGGLPVDLDHLEEIKLNYKKKYGKELAIIQDAAHCFDSRFKGKLIGSDNNYTCFSFQAIKFLTISDGGCLTLPNEQVYERAELLKWFGLNRKSGASFRCIQDITESGFKYHVNDIASAIGLANLPYIQGLANKHRDNANYYYDNLIDIPNLQLLQYDRQIYDSSFWLFTIKVDRRDDFVKMLANYGVAVSPVHARCDKHSCVKQFKIGLPNMDLIENNYICIPVGWWVNKEDREYIVNCIKKGW